MSRYPERWRKFMGYDVATIYGMRVIADRIIVHEEEGSTLYPVDISSDEEEEFVPVKMSDDENDE
jgi:hypothetical protein